MNQVIDNIILIRGLGKSSMHWGDLIPYLKELYPHGNIITLEIPGNGTLNTHKSPPSIKEMVIEMRQQFLKMGFSNSQTNKDIIYRNHLVAISLGGMIATYWLNHFSHDFDIVTLLNISNGKYSPFFKRLKLKALYQLIKIALSLSIEKKEELTLELVANDKEKRKSSLSNWVQIATNHPVKISNLFHQLKAAFLFNDSPQWDHPTLLIASKKDRMVSWQCSQVLHIEFNFPIIYHPSAGHAVATDDPKWVANQLFSWSSLNK